MVKYTLHIFSLLKEKNFAANDIIAKEKYYRLLTTLAHILSEKGIKQLNQATLINILHDSTLSEDDQKSLHSLEKICCELYDRIENHEIRIQELEDNHVSSTPESILSRGVLLAHENNNNPGTLLTARYEIVPFYEKFHENTLSELNEWCFNNLALTETRLYYGEGGSGKTRLFIEWIKRLSENYTDWTAGFLPLGSTKADYDIICSSSKPTFVVIDYSECRHDIDILFKSILKYENKRNILRIVFLARESSWLDSCKRISNESNHILNQTGTFSVPIISNDIEDRTLIYKHAYSAFQTRLGKAIPSGNIPDLSDNKFKRILYILKL